MPVKLFNDSHVSELENQVNEFLSKNKPENPKFHYSVSSFGYMGDHGFKEETNLFSVLISWLPSVMD